MAGWNRRLVLSLSVVATIHIISTGGWLIQTNAASARRYLNENTLYDDGTRIVVRSLHNVEQAAARPSRSIRRDQGSADNAAVA